MNVASLFTEIRDWLDWAPDWLTAVCIIAVAIVAAIAIHAAGFAALRRVVPYQRPIVSILLERTRVLLRFALALFVVGLALPAAPIPANVSGTLQQLLFVAFIVLVGWAAIISVDIASRFYLRRFQIDTEDNLIARKHTTQVRVLERVLETLIVVFTVAGVLMTFEPVREYGVSLLASAGVAGIIAGLAARPVLSNLFAGLQIAVTQPIRIDDVVIVENEWGRIEEITSTYVVIRIWDLRRLVVPLSYFIERPFENWTRETAALLAPVMLHLDYSAPVAAIREQLDVILAGNRLWDGKVKSVQVTEARESTIEVRLLLSAANSSAAWDLRCEVREKMIAFLQQNYPDALPRQRGELEIAAPDKGGNGSERSVDRHSRGKAEPVPQRTAS